MLKNLFLTICLLLMSTASSDVLSEQHPLDIRNHVQVEAVVVVNYATNDEE